MEMETGSEVIAAKPKSVFLRRLRWFGVTCLLGVIAGVAFAALIIWQGAHYEDLQNLEAYKPKLYTKIHDRNGVLLTTISAEKRIILDYEDIPTEFVHALVAVEDEAFFDHIGVSPMGILAAAKDNITKGTMRGASTLTQQLVKNITKDSRASYKRKIKEQFLAVQLEARFTKEEIFAMYANEVAFGNNQFGIEAAAKYYFGKSVGSLSLVECATLAGLPQAPSRFNPFRYPERCKTKRNIVLKRMLEEEYITRAGYEKGLSEPLVLREKQEQARQVAAHFIDKVRNYLFETYGEDTVRTSAWDVYTTIDVRYQRIAEEAVRSGLKDKDKTLGYRNYDCLSILAGTDKAAQSELLENYFDTTWQRTPQAGINMRALVMAVEKDTITVRIKNASVTLDKNNMLWVARQIRDMHKYFKVGDTPLFLLEEKTVTTTAEEDKSQAAMLAELAAEDKQQGETMGSPQDAPPSDPKVFPFKLILDQEPDIEGAFVAIDPKTGDILAMVGGYDYRRSKFNRAEQARRQVGSCIKPLIFGSALENGYTLADLVVDEPTQFWDPNQLQISETGELELFAPHGERARRIRLGLIPRPEPYQPDNYYNTYDGKVSLRRALSHSTNIVAVKLLNSVGYDHVLEYADRLKLLENTDLQPYPSLALGAPEITLKDLTYAYGTFGNEGVRYKPRFLRSIMDAKGLYIEKNEKEGEQVISPQNAYLVTSGLKSVINGRHGTAGAARKLRMKNIGGKTGTTNDYTNTWFIGFSRQVAAGVWVGRDLNHTIGRGSTGSNTALPIWMRFMEEIKADLTDEPFPMPEGITTVPVDYLSGKKITRDCDCDQDDIVLEVFIKGTEPTEVCTAKDRALLELPWYLQKRAYQLDEKSQIKASLEEINYPSQKRALRFLKERKLSKDIL